jgi:predicted AlkP superfamily pyrophosphatase or phosphodiesterase
MHKTVVINVVGLTPALLGPHTPRLTALARQGARANIEAVLPAVTCSVQSTYLTGVWPAEHGIVGNGWYFRDECEIRFWRQADALVQRPRLWEAAKALDPHFTCANLFWWYNMYASADYSATPRPMYPADGRKIPDLYTQPADLRSWLQAKLGRFPLFHFWGPAADIRSSRWITEAAILVDQRFNPTLSLVYLPHLDYPLQRLGPDMAAIAKDLEAVDALCGRLIDHFAARGARIIVLSEYGITSVRRPVHLNRVLREHGLLVVRDEMGRELLDPGASAAFAVADHQVAHIYINDISRKAQVLSLLSSVPGVAQVLDENGKRQWHLDHPRAGDLVAIAQEDSWFTWYHWLDDAKAPDFARTVDIHRKTGYDPAELFLDPRLCCPKLRIAAKLAKRALGLRTLMDVIPLDASLVRGSHGAPPSANEHEPLLISSAPALLTKSSLPPTEVYDVILRHLQA